MWLLECLFILLLRFQCIDCTESNVLLWRYWDFFTNFKGKWHIINSLCIFLYALVDFDVVCMIRSFTKFYAMLYPSGIYIATSITYINLVAIRPIISLAMLQNCFTRCWGKILSTKLNEPPRWIDVEWFMLSGSLGPCLWCFSPKECTCGLPPKNKEMMKSFQV